MENHLSRLLKNEMSRRKARNPSYSQRAFARDIGLSAASLNKVLRGETLHSNSIKKLLTNFDGVDAGIKNQILKNSNSRDYVQTGIDEVFSGLELAWEQKYVIPKTLTVRTLKRFKEKNKDTFSPHFEDNFFSNERQVSCRGYYVQHNGNSYYSFLLENFSKKPPTDWPHKQNKNMFVTFDDHGFPTIKNMVLTVVGENKLLEGEMIYSKEKAIITGKQYDLKFPEVKDQAHVVYHAFEGI